MDHYTRSTRLQDHQTVIDYLKNNPPKGWNGKFIYLGISEGGVIINSLTEKNTDTTIATMNFSGAGHWSWRDELWVFIQRMKKDIPWHIKLRILIPQCLPFSIRLDLPSTRKEYDNTMDEILKSPSPNTEFMGMSYQYHADAMLYPPMHYEKLKTPILVVSGAQDTIINSSDEFVKNAKKANVPITYFRIHDMDHYIQHRPDIINQSFEWLKTILIQNDH